MDADNGKRQQLAAHYSKLLARQALQLPAIRENAEHVFHLYVIRTDKRHKLMAHLKTNEIQTGIHYPMPVHLQPAYKDRIRTAANMSVTERIADEVLSLPIYPEFLSADVARVIEAINSYFTKSADS